MDLVSDFCRLALSNLKSSNNCPSHENFEIQLWPCDFLLSSPFGPDSSEFCCCIIHSVDLMNFHSDSCNPTDSDIMMLKACLANRFFFFFVIDYGQDLAGLIIGNLQI
jgi:hypothetical protein